MKLLKSNQPEIQGLQLDAAGRCLHYHGQNDIAALWCVRCQQYFACYQCHDALHTHPFQACSAATGKVLCGNCRQELSVSTYLQGRCPNCQHLFNPRCSRHHRIYFN